MFVSKLTVFLMILKLCCLKNRFNDDDLNSYINFGKKVQFFLESTENGISNKCQDHMYEYVNSLSNATNWALKMFDATSKLPTGIMNENTVDLGFFDECLEIKSSSTQAKTGFGKYCIGTLITDNEKQKQLPHTTKVITPNYKFGICAPKTCSAVDLQKIYAGIGINMEFSRKLCQVKSELPKLDFGGIATLSFLGVILFIMLVCTAYDVILHYTKKNPPLLYLTSFSVLTNGKKLLRISNNSDQISCLYGIRVISTMWIILYHRYVYQTTFPVRNYLYVAEWINNEANMFIINATLSVDTFFLLSGLVVTYIYMITLSKGIKFNIILFYLHRYIRLTPVLAVIVLIHATLLKYLGSGPLYPSTINPQLVEGCEKYWWKTILYFQNYREQDSYCVPQSWYLCVDTQLFFLSPIILIPLKKWPGRTLVATGILTVCSMVISFLTGWFLELNISNAGSLTGTSTLDFMKWYYVATQTRAGPWFMGMILGYYIFQIKQKNLIIKISKWLNFVIWVASLVVLCLSVFAGHNLIFGEYDKLASSIYMALVRPAWAIAVSWIIFACVIGYGGTVNWFLSLPIFQILSKFTYTLYLLHLQIIFIMLAEMRTPPVFSNGEMMYAFWGDLAVSFGFATLFILAFELPMITIEQALLGRRNS